MQLPWLKQRKTAQGCLGIEINHGRAWAVHRTQRGVVSSYIAASRMSTSEEIEKASSRFKGTRWGPGSCSYVERTPWNHAVHCRATLRHGRK